MSTPTEPLRPDTYPDVAPAAVQPPEAKRERPVWAVIIGIGLWIASVLLMAVLQITFLLPYSVRQGIGLQQLADFATNDPTAVFLQIVALIPAHLLTLGMAWLVVTQLRRRPFFGSLGWEWGGGFTLWRSVLLAVVLVLIGFGVIYLEGSPETPLVKIINSSRATALTAAFLATFTAPLVEEVVYRGVLYGALERAIGAVWAAIIVLLLFALVHVPQYITSIGVMFTILMLSTVLTVIRARTGKLLPCFIIHLVFNGIQSVLIVLQPYLERYAPETPTPPAPDPAALLSLLGLAGLFN